MQCTQTCGEGCEGGTCNPTDGTCLCLPGWKPPMCEKRRENITGDLDCSALFHGLLFLLDLNYLTQTLELEYGKVRKNALNSYGDGV